MKIERELMRGAGPTAVLQLLSAGEKYGYELVEALSRQTDGVLAMGQSTLYPMLYNLEAKKLVKSRIDEKRPATAALLSAHQQGRTQASHRHQAVASPRQRHAFTRYIATRCSNGRCIMPLALESFWRRLRYTPLRDVVRGQLNGRLDWRFLLLEADLPTEITDTIKQVVHKTRLWHAERVDVAQELIAHFSRRPRNRSFCSGDNRRIRRGSTGSKTNTPGKTAQPPNLVADAARRLLVHRLLSRNLRPSRPLHADRTPHARHTDYLAVINSRVDAQGEAAWPHYRKAMLALGWRSAQPPKGPILNSWYETDIAAKLDAVAEDEDSSVDASDKPPTLRDFLKKHQLQLADLREATTTPRLGFTIGQSNQSEDTELLGRLSLETPADEPPEMISILIGHVQILNHAGILLACDAVLAAESGDAQRAYDNLTASLRVVHHVQNEPFLVSGLISLGIEWTTLKTIGTIFRDHLDLFSDDQLASLAHRIAAKDPPIDNWFESERLMMLDIMQRIYGKSGRVTHAGALYLGQLDAGLNPIVDTREMIAKTDIARHGLTCD